MAQKAVVVKTKTTKTIVDMQNQLQTTRRKTRQPSQNHQNKFPADSPMSDFMDWRLAHLTRQQYLIRLKMFFDYIGLHGSLDKQSREFLIRARKDKEWAQNGLKYFIRDKKQRVEEGQSAKEGPRN